MDDERRTAMPNAPRLAPEDIATRAFSSAFRGVSESEVRSFLKRVADEMTAASQRERELRESLESAQAKAEHREPLDESELLEALGEETAKLLRSAREAAHDIRAKAEDAAARVRSEAAQDAQRVRDEADGVLEARRAEADAEIADLRARVDAEVEQLRADAEADAIRARADAEAEANALRSEASADAERQLSEAKSTGRAMLEEAKALRERVLADLAHRRGLLHAQIGELKAGRESLLDAYRTVKRSFLEATQALSAAEANAAANRPDPVDEAAIAAAYDAAVVDDTAEELGANLAVDHEAVTPSGEPAAVQDLFARIRAQAEPSATDETVADGTPDTDVDGGIEEIRDAANEDAVNDNSEGAIDNGVDVAAPATEAATEEANPVTADDARPEPQPPEDAPGHAQQIRSIVGAVVKRAKRASQDEQNDVLDALRRAKGRAVGATVLPEIAAQNAAWVDALHESLALAYSAGFGSEAPAPSDLVLEVVTELNSGLRARLVDAIEVGDLEGVTERVNARYREWKSQDLEELLVDAHHAVYVSGTFASVGAGTSLRWVVSGVCCADCDDNSHETVLRGAAFPTGHVLPPAHSGCRCTIEAVEGSLA